MTRIAPIRFTQDVLRLTEFHTLLGLEEKTAETSPGWAYLKGSGGELGIHIAAPNSPETQQALSFQVNVDDEELEAVHARLTEAEFQPGSISTESFGRYFTVADPDGYVVQVNSTPAA